MKNKCKKTIILGIIILFLGISIIPSNAIVNDNNHIKTNQINNDQNYLGTIYINFTSILNPYPTSPLLYRIEFKTKEFEHYNVSVIGGIAKFNFTVNCSGRCRHDLLMTRYAIYHGEFGHLDITWGKNDIIIPLKTQTFGVRFPMYLEWEMDYNSPPINGAESMDLTVYLSGRGFPFGFFAGGQPSFKITVDFIEN